MKAADEARRIRAGVIGALECCRCLYPRQHYETETMHAEDCPAHAMTLSARAAGSTSAWFVVSLDIDAPLEVVEATERIARRST